MLLGHDWRELMAHFAAHALQRSDVTSARNEAGERTFLERTAHALLTTFLRTLAFVRFRRHVRPVGDLEHEAFLTGEVLRDGSKVPYGFVDLTFCIAPAGGAKVRFVVELKSVLDSQASLDRVVRGAKVQVQEYARRLRARPENAGVPFEQWVVVFSRSGEMRLCEQVQVRV